MRGYLYYVLTVVFLFALALFEYRHPEALFWRRDSDKFFFGTVRGWKIIPAESDAIIRKKRELVVWKYGLLFAGVTAVLFFKLIDP